MASAIDPSQPEDGVPADKAVLRANLAAAKTELEHGGFADGFAPTRYGPPASDRVKDHLAAIDSALAAPGAFTGLADTPADYAAQGARFVKVRADETGLEFASAPGGSGGLSGWTDVKADHGAVGDGAVDDTTALQNALGSGASVVYFPAGTYRVTAPLTVLPGTMIVGTGPQNTIIDGRSAGQNNENAILDCTGSLTSLPGLSSPVASGDGSIAFSSSVGATLRHGDWVRIRDTTANSLNIEGDRDGFYFMVNSAEGSTLYPAMPCLRTLPAARTAGPLSAVEARKMDGRGLILRDLTVWGKGFDAASGDLAISGIIVQCTDLANVYLDRVDLLGGASGAFQPRDCCNVHLNDCRFSVNQGKFNDAGAYALFCWGTGYLTATNCRLLSVRHATNFEARSMPAHDILILGGFIGAPGDDVFQSPDNDGQVIALDWHEGTYASRVIGAHIRGSVDFRGSDMTVEGCLVEGAPLEACVAGTFSCWKINNLNIRIVDNDIVVRNTHWKGSGCLFEMSDGDLNQDEGLPGSLLFANNRIRIEKDTTQALFRLHDTTAKAVHTGTIHILGNQVVQCACSTTQPLFDNDLADMEEMIVINNILPGNVSYGTPDSSSFDRYQAVNVIDGHTVYDGLPTSNPGGSGRLWNDAGTLKIS